MVTPALFEDSMEIYLQNPSVENKEKALADTISVLKQYGYDSGASLFDKLLHTPSK